LAGVTYAVVQEIEGMISDYSVNYGELKVIITGGDSPFFVTRLKSKIFAHSNLVLAGLNKILEYNVEGL
jgi:type III pantothenate kinase